MFQQMQAMAQKQVSPPIRCFGAPCHSSSPEKGRGLGRLYPISLPNLRHLSVYLRISLSISISLIFFRSANNALENDFVHGQRGERGRAFSLSPRQDL